MDAFDRLAQATAEADSHDQVILVDGTDEVSDAASRRRGENRQAEQRNLIFEVIGEKRGEITGEKDDAARVIETFRERDEARGIKAILEAVQIFQILLEGVANKGR